jgi:hypothetical protein
MRVALDTRLATGMRLHRHLPMAPPWMRQLKVPRQAATLAQHVSADGPGGRSSSRVASLSLRTEGMHAPCVRAAAKATAPLHDARHRHSTPLDKLVGSGRFIYSRTPAPPANTRQEQAALLWVAYPV